MDLMTYAPAGTAENVNVPSGSGVMFTAPMSAPAVSPSSVFVRINGATTGPPAPGGIDLGLLCLLIWVLAGLALLGAAVFRDALRTWPSGP